MKKLYKFLKYAYFLIFISVGGVSWGQMSLTNANPNNTIDFSNSMQIGIGTNSSTVYSGTGFSLNPSNSNSGRLNSAAWAITGWSDGSLAFEGTQSAGDYARGSTSVAVTTGGLYAYTGSPQSSSNPCLMIQPGGSDWAPGTITLRIINNGTTNIAQLSVSYNLYIRNDQGRANSFNFSYSADNSTYTSVSSLDYTSTAVADALGWIQVGTSPSRSTTISSVSIAPGNFFYLRWSGADVSGSGSRDEFGLDDISISASFATSCTPPTVSATGLNTTVTTNTINLAWTNPPSGADGVIVVARSVSGVNQNPSSGTAYAQSPIYGNGANLTNGNFVVYTGTGNNVSITGLNASTTYHFAIYTYTNTGLCYNTTNVLTGSGTTLQSLGATFWDGDGSSTINCGGNGIWSTSSTTFSSDASCSSTGYTQGSGELTFGNTVGAVQVFGIVNVNNGLKFSTNGYSISNGTAISFGGTTQQINKITTEVNVTVSISTPISVSNGLTKSGSGTLSLSGVNTISGGIALSGGTLYGANNNAFGTSSLSISNANLFAGSNVNIANVISVNSAISYTPYSVNFDFTSASASTIIGLGYSVTTITQGNNFGTTTLITSSSASSGYTGATGGNNAGAAATIGGLNTASNGSAFFEFTLTPTIGAISLSSLQFGSRSTGTGPQTYSLRSSLDNYSTDLATGSLSNNSTWVLLTPTLISTVTNNIASPLTFRIYGYNGSGSPSSGTANWRIDDLSFGGNVVIMNEAKNIIGSDINSGITTFSGNITLNENTTLTSSLGGTVLFSGNILNGSSSSNVTKIGSGTVQYSGSNSYIGATNINEGILILSKSGGGTLPSTNSITVNSGGTLIINSNQILSNLIVNSGGTLIINDGVTLTLTQPIQINGSIILNSTGLITSSPSTTFTINSGATLATGNSLGIAGAIGTFSSKIFNSGINCIFNGSTAQSTGFNGLTINTPSNIIISNSSNTTGVTIDANINSSGVVSVSGNSILTMPNGISITKSGSGVLSISGIVKTANALGFSDISSNASFKGYTSSDINLLSGSTVEYNGTVQSISNQLLYQNLLFSGVTTITAPSNVLRVEGNFINNLSTGVFKHNNGIVSLTGANQTIAGTAVTDFYKLNLAGSGTKTFADSVRVFHTLSITSPVNINVVNKALTLVSDQSYTARLGIVPSGSEISGNMNMQRFVPAKKAYRFFSTAVQGNNLTKLKRDIFLTNFTNDRGFDVSSVIIPSLLWYVESVSGSLDFGWRFASSINYNLIVGRGYSLFVKGSRADDINSSNSSAITAAGSNVVINSIGTPNYGDVNLNATFTNSGGITADGWNLVGNPYASEIDWDNESGWTKNNIEETITLYDPGTTNTTLTGTIGKYVSYKNGVASDGSSNRNIIASSQAFWIKATSVGSNLIVKESAKTEAAHYSNFRDTYSKKLISLKVLNKNGDYDISVLRLESDASVFYDSKYDANKFKNSGLNIFTKTPYGEHLGINAITVIDSVEIAFDVNPKTDSLKISLSEQPNYQYFLIDKYKGKIQNLTNEIIIDFDNSVESKSDGRFKLLIKRNALVEQTTDDSVIISDSTLQLSENGTENVQEIEQVTSKSADLLSFIQIYPNPLEGKILNMEIGNSKSEKILTSITNQYGQILMSKTFNNNSKNVLTLEGFEAGVYILQLSTNEEKKVIKLVLK